MVTDHIRDVENASSSLAYPTKKLSKTRQGKKRHFKGLFFVFGRIIPPRGLKCLKTPKNGQRMDILRFVQISVGVRTQKMP